MTIITVVFLALGIMLTAGCSGGGASSNSDAVTSSPTGAEGPDVPDVPDVPDGPSPPPVSTLAIQSDIFESGPVRTTALSPDGSRLFVTNMANHSLEIFNVVAGGIELSASVSVGLEPVAVAAKSNTEVWVVNHLSDSVSIVDVSSVPRVINTLLIGDEPRDIVFAGIPNQRAFITAAYRGQNHPTFTVADLKVEGLGRADVWVFDPADLGTQLGGEPVTIINLFADSPRALAVTPDQSTVYAAAFMSGNQTTTVGNAPEVDAGKALPVVNIEGERQPATGLIVKFSKADSTWRDNAGTDWSSSVKFDLPDFDVFEINANAAPPALVNTFSGVGTTLFNMAVNPVNGNLYVSNTDARNVVRFEGPGEQPGATSVRGNIAKNRITVIDGASVLPRQLNKHVDFSIHEGESLAAGEKEKSLAQPQDMVISSDGATMYMAAFGSNKIARFATADIDSDTFTPNAADHLILPVGGPAGLALSGDNSRLYVYSRFDNSIQVIDTASFSILSSTTMFTPESASIQRGRQILYDANLSSANGTASCGSCHIFGDLDALAWDLGNPDGLLVENINEFVRLRNRTFENFHPMKGPMTTQTFRGMADSGPLHWRGDRFGNNPVEVNGLQEQLEAGAFKEFNPAFVGLLGRETELDEADMQSFTDFSLSLVPPPNPIRNLDNSLTIDQAEGQRVYLNDITTGGALTCNHCHVLDVSQKHFGTDGKMTNEGPGITEDFKVPHLRNVYTKVGMFGESDNLAVFGDQIKGFGMLHDGAISTVSSFLQKGVFDFDSDAQREQVVDFMFAFDTNLAPVVGQQVTLQGSDGSDVIARRDLLVARALENSPEECDLIAKAVIGGVSRGAFMQEGGTFLVDDGTSLSLADLSSQANTAGQEITFTCVQPGFGQRMGVDQNLDGILNAN
jgi:DNA-binding beta-propeller fold protein YncE